MARGLHLRLVALGFLGLLACGSDPPLTKDEALSRWAKAICDFARRCDPGRLTPFGATPETCEARLMSDLTSNGDPRCLGGGQFDGDAARACIQEIETGACMKDGRNESCDRVCT
jgi:hypothetical protein